MCCIPLLFRWFISHLPRSVMKNEQGLRWSQRLMSLAHSDIHWCSRSQADVTIINLYGEFPNVPLLGIRGESFITLLQLCVSLVMLKGTVLVICSSRVLCSTMRTILKISMKGLYVLGARLTRLIARIWDTRIPFLQSLTSDGCGLVLRILKCHILLSCQ